jgi:hypothetical protein
VPVSQGKYTSAVHNICTGDEDYYKVLLLEGETITARALFSHALGDIDLYIHDAAGVNLTPCCNSANGQSYDDDERIQYTVPAGVNDYFYVVVDGYGEANAPYDLCISLNAADCP